MSEDKPAGLDYRIFVPSKGRPQNMHRIQTLLPTATIVVAQDEYHRYAMEVEAKNLVTHPGASEGVVGLPSVYNWCIEHFDEATVIEADDDLENVFCWTGEGSRRNFKKMSDHRDILQIMENMVQLAEDLDITAFGWTKSMNAAFAKMDHRPFHPVGLVSNVFGVRGAARRRPYDPAMIGRASIDWTLRTLLKDRCVMIDKRVFFDCGKIFGGSGGNAGIVTSEKFRLSTERLKETWGRHVRFGIDPNGAAKHKKLDAKGRTISGNQGDRQVMMAVSRSNPAATR